MDTKLILNVNIIEEAKSYAKWLNYYKKKKRV